MSLIATWFSEGRRAQDPPVPRYPLRICRWRVVISPSQGHDDVRQFCGRIGMREAAADRAAVADLVMRHGAQRRMRALRTPILLNVAPAHLGAELHAVIVNDNVVEPRDPAQIHQEAWGREPEGEDRH